MVPCQTSIPQQQVGVISREYESLIRQLALSVELTFIAYLHTTFLVRKILFPIQLCRTSFLSIIRF